MAVCVTACVFALQAVPLLLPLWHDRVGVLAFIALFGLGFSAVTIARASLVAGTMGLGTTGPSAAFVIRARTAAPVGADFGEIKLRPQLLDAT